MSLGPGAGGARRAAQPWRGGLPWGGGGPGPGVGRGAGRPPLHPAPAPAWRRLRAVLRTITCLLFKKWESLDKRRKRYLLFHPLEKHHSSHVSVFFSISVPNAGRDLPPGHAQGSRLTRGSGTFPGPYPPCGKPVTSHTQVCFMRFPVSFLRPRPSSPARAECSPVP